MPDEGAHYRAFKANENQREWFTYTLPFVFLFAAYGSELPFVGKYSGPATLAASVLWSHFNVSYAKGYTKDAKQRISGFRGRTNVFKFLMIGSIASLACVAGRHFGVPIPK